MAAKEIIMNTQARRKVQAGLDKLANAVKVTLGPKGRNVLIEKSYGAPHITKDGVTVAKSIELSDNGGLDATVAQQKLEQVSGVSRVVAKETRDGHLRFEVESLQGRHVRPELARTIVESGWNLHELHPVAFSLEEIFLQLTSADTAESGGAQ